MLGDEVYHGEAVPSDEESLYGPEVRSVHAPASIREMSDQDLSDWESSTTESGSFKLRSWTSERREPRPPPASLYSDYTSEHESEASFGARQDERATGPPSFSSLPPPTPPKERAFRSGDRFDYGNLPRRRPRSSSTSSSSSR